MNPNLFISALSSIFTLLNTALRLAEGGFNRGSFLFSDLWPPISDLRSLISDLCLSKRSVDPAIGAPPAQWNLFICFIGVKFFEEKERSEFNRGPLTSDFCSSYLLSSFLYSDFRLLTSDLLTFYYYNNNRAFFPVRFSKDFKLDIILYAWYSYCKPR